MPNYQCHSNPCDLETILSIASGPEQRESMEGELCSGTSTWSLSVFKAEKYINQAGRFRPQQNSLSTPAGTTYRPQQIWPRQVLYTDPSRNSRPQRHKCFLLDKSTVILLYVIFQHNFRSRQKTWSIKRWTLNNAKSKKITILKESKLVGQRNCNLAKAKIYIHQGL